MCKMKMKGWRDATELRQERQQMSNKAENKSHFKRKQCGVEKE